MVKYIKIKGNDCYFQQCWGIGWVDTKQPKEIIAMVREYDIQYVEKKINNEDAYCLSHGTPNITNGVFSLAYQRIMVHSIEECTPSEIEQINAALDYHGMYWGTKEITKKSTRFVHGQGFIHETRTQTCETLYWKSKDDMVLVVDGQRIHYKDIDKCEHGEHMCIGGDNGYSHYWSDSEDYSKLKELVDKMFDEGVLEERHSNFHHGIVFADCELYGYHFDEFGALKVRTYSGKKHERVSVVSNT